MLRVELDGIIFALQKIGGISIYHSELLQNASDGLSYLVGLPKGTRINPVLLAQDHLTKAQEFAKRQYPRRLLERIRRYQADTEYCPQVVHTSYYRTLSSPRVPLVVTAHDFTVEAFGPRNLYQRLHVIQKRQALSEARKIIAISESTRNDLERLYGSQIAEKTTVVLNGVSDAFLPRPGMQRKSQSMFVGSRAAYKGFDIAIDIAARMPGMHLKIVGGGPLSSAEQHLLQGRLSGRFEHVGVVSQSELVDAYTASQFLLYPSSYEGFGIPAIEAARCGCIPVVFKTSSLPEVVNTKETIFPLGTSGADIADELCALSTADLKRIRSRGEAFAKGFSWRKCAVETEQVLASASG